MRVSGRLRLLTLLQATVAGEVVVFGSTVYSIMGPLHVLSFALVGAGPGGKLRSP